MTFIVHGATGAQGSPVLAALLASGHQATGAVRSPWAGRAGSVAADYSSVDSLVEAYRGASGVFVHLPVGSAEQHADAAANVAIALDRADVPRVVMSTSGYPMAAGSGPAVLADALQSAGRSYAVLDPRLFLENLLLPTVMEAVHGESVLRYPIRADYPLSWISHLDVADAATALLVDSSITGRVAVGALPPLLGSDLAAGFTAHLGKAVHFQAQDPEDFGRQIIPMFGEQAARPVIDSYTWRLGQESDVIDTDASAQQRLDLTPRTIPQWLADVGA